MNYLQKTKSTLVVYLFLVTSFSYQAMGQVDLIDISISESADTPDLVIIDLQFAIEDDHYIQSNTPADSNMLSTFFEVTAGQGISIQKISYHTATQLMVAGEKSLETVFRNMLTVRMRGSRTKKNITLEGFLFYQMCSVGRCFFPKELNISFGVNTSEQFARVPIEY